MNVKMMERFALCLIALVALLSPLLSAAAPLEVLEDGPYAHGEATRYTKIVIGTLQKVTKRYESKKRDEAEEILEALVGRGILPRLIATSDELAKNAQKSFEEAKGLVAKCNDGIATNNDEIKSLNKDQVEKQAALESTNTQIAETNKIISQLNAESDELIRKRNGQVAKRKKTLKWSWVPGYGTYLAIDLLIDEISGKLGGIMRDLRSNTARQHELNYNKAVLTTELGVINNDLKTSKDNLDRDKTTKKILEENSKKASAIVSSSIESVDYCRTMANALDNLKANPDNAFAAVQNIKDVDLIKTLKKVAEEWDGSASVWALEGSHQVVNNGLLPWVKDQMS